MVAELTPELVEEIRDVVSRNTLRTPLLPSPRLSAHTGVDVFLKCENLQVTGSFKVRGGFAALHLLPEAARGSGVITASAGNHGLGLARAASVFDVPCTVVIPQSAPRVKEEGIRADGARVVRSPHEGYDDTQTWTMDHREELGGTFISPFEDPAVMAGNGGTTFLEILEDLPGLDTLVVPCGGGGFVAGAGIVARSRGAGIRVVAVNTDASPGMWLSRRDGRPHLRVTGRPTIAEGIEGGVGERTFRIGQEVIDEVVVVPEAGIRRAVREVAQHERMVVEGSGAAGVAALLHGPAPSGPTVVVLTGSNIDADRFRTLLAG